jgi:hypothetical protein
MMLMNAHALVEILYYITIQFVTTCDNPSFVTMFSIILQYILSLLQLITIFLILLLLLRL